MAFLAEQKVKEILSLADVAVGGGNKGDIRVHDSRFFERVLAKGSLGLGESYMDGWWDATELDEFFAKILAARLDRKVKRSPSIILAAIAAKILNFQSERRAFIVGKKHYDLGNDLFSAMLDRRLVYTCAYWKNARNLDEAQEHKLDLVCKKLGLQAGQKILDIGCGWGSFAKFAAEKYGVIVVGITVSREQVALGAKLCEGLPVELRLQDYRKLDEKFDHIVSLGMFEHVGSKNYRIYMEVVRRCLNEDGLFLLHTIGSNVTTFSVDPWILKYIFPNGMLPSIAQIATSIEGLFVMEDWHNFGADYDTTLMAWHKNLENHWGELSKRYDERFHRMWNYYLLSCAGSFRVRNIELWQIVLSKEGLRGGYNSIR